MDEQATATNSMTTTANTGCVISEEWFGRTVVLGASGVIDMLTSPRLEVSIATSLKKNPSAIIVDLTDVEFALLEALMNAPGKVVTREDISENVLGRKFHPFDRSLDMHVSRLRRKLSGKDAAEDLVKTIRGTGYQLAVDANPPVAKD